MQTRRSLLKGAVAFGIGCSLSSTAATAQADGASARPQEGDLIVKPGDQTLTPLTPSDVVDVRQLAMGSAPTTAWAMDPRDRTVRSGSRLNGLLLIRFDPSQLAEATRGRAAAGVVAYTAICTHTGCDVGDWVPEEQALSCPCHFSKFDPKDEGKVLDGPAPRMLPALPLKLVDGRLIVAGSFTSRVGFESL